MIDKTIENLRSGNPSPADLERGADFIEMLVGVMEAIVQNSSCRWAKYEAASILEDIEDAD